MKSEIDILANIENFLVKGGLQEFINDFRNPSIDAMVHAQAVYIRTADILGTTIHGYYEFPYDFCLIRYFKVELERKLNKLKSEALHLVEKFKQKHKNNPSKLKWLNDNLVEEFKSKEHQLKQEKELSEYWSLLETFLSETALESLSIITEQVARLPFKLSFKKRCSEKTLSEIYYFDMNKGSFIDRDGTTKEDFVTIFTATNIYEVDEKIKIHLDCNTRTAAYILEQMERLFFTNLNRRTIGQSEKFYSKWGGIITQNGLEVALDEKKGEVKYQKDIDKFFAKLVLAD
ncbi:hypothetical protein OCK74_21930 [Chitinophagaceae bacterium LB-8]|uniref:Uncharacterized protein n=1 Tax=Paraflavisolibacter caeni TaxID=2982496 RepID=A0A9X3B9V1_9BACT|nr:hypothetical protein [Paraflavisolibacter caeni]MCU7551796.1 hypothetical protein [Paraflavisolibacter caeni]